MKKLALLTSALIILVGCSAPLQTVFTPKVPQPPLPPKPRPMTILDFEWHVFKDENDEVWFALTTEGYEHLIMNVAEFERYIRQLESNSVYYRDVIRTKEQDAQERGSGN